MKKKKITPFLKLSFGNILEWYDFSLYIYFAGSIALTFFPSENHYIGMLLAFFTFFLGFIARPLGGLMMGWFGDRYGRKYAVNLCVILMGITTFLVAFIPTYHQIGILAPTLLIIFRIIQGISVGGQFPGLLSLSVDDYKKSKGFTIGMVYSISSLGFLCASLVSFIVALLFSTQSQLIWRIPFALSGVLFVIFLYMNRHQIKAGAYTSNSKKKHVIRSLLAQWRSIIAVIALTTMAASLYFLVFTYLVNYQIEYLSVSSESAYLVNTFALVLACLVYPIFGLLADRVGYLKLFVVAVGLLLILTLPLIWMIQTKVMINALVALYIFTLLMAALQGAISPLFASVFNKDWRTTGCAFSYSIGNGLAGAAPLIAEVLAHYQPFYGISLFVIALLLIGMLGMYMIYSIKPEVLVSPIKHSAIQAV
ncbi:MFS transporter [Thiotrichales bacterium 19S3-7]|nr:MFS transporter [Thiotrichales bacterium 19S3-7]MCF6801154.1 MFS transporter [Thiotrichales bacterium 19S3-11]